MGADSLWEPYTPVRTPPAGSTPSRRSTPRPPTTPPSTPPPPTPPPDLDEPRAKWYRRPLAVAALALLLIVAGGCTAAYVASERLGDNVARVETFGGLDEATRPPVTATLNVLLVGTDSRSEATPPGVAADGSGSPADVVMVAHVAADMKSATVVSIPRDSLVDIPDHGRGRVSQAYATGGPRLLVRTIERLTNLRMNHFAVIDFAGFRSMVDTLGGIDVDVTAPLAGFDRGVNHMDGGRALLYVRDDTGWTTGERARRQQNALRSIMDKAVSSNVLTDPVRFYDFLDAVSRFMSVDETLSNGEMRVVALQLSGLRPENVLFLRAPVGALIQDRGAPTVQLDAARSAALWSAVAQGTAEVYVQQNGRDALGPVTR